MEVAAVGGRRFGQRLGGARVGREGAPQRQRPRVDELQQRLVGLAPLASRRRRRGHAARPQPVAAGGRRRAERQVTRHVHVHRRRFGVDEFLLANAVPESVTFGTSGRDIRLLRLG